ncbi:MAG: hypothetical protein AAGC57_12365 [Pseudomonadota bacterium]
MLTRFRDFYKTVYVLSFMATLLAKVIVWQFPLQPTVGVVNDLLASGCGSWLAAWGLVWPRLRRGLSQLAGRQGLCHLGGDLCRRLSRASA